MTIKLFLLLLLSFICGIIANKLAKGPADGAFIFDTSDPQKDFVKLVVDTDIDQIPNKKYVRLKVITNRAKYNDYNEDKSNYIRGGK